jgi:uncharacterized membrane protein
MPKFRSLTSPKFWLLGIILLAALLIRLNHLTDRSLWFDEAFSWRLIEFPFFEFLSRSAADVHPILYYIFLWLWCAPLYLFKLTISLFWLRLFSVILSVGTVAATYYAGKTLFQSRRIGIAAALLTAVSAFQIQYAWEARMYALGTLLLCLCLAFLIKTTNAKTNTNAWRNGIIFGLLTSALFHVHYFMLFSIAAIFLFVAIFSFLQIIKLSSPEKKSVLPLIAGSLLAIVIFLPWFPVFLKQRAQVQQSYWIPPMDNWSIPNTMSRLLLGGTNDFSHRTSVICSVLVVLILFTPLIFGRKKGDFLLFLSFVVPFAGSWWLSRGTSIYQDRYFVFASLALILLAARCIYFFPSRFHIKSIVIIILACYSFYNVTQFWSSLHFKDHPGTIAAAKYIEENANWNEPILVSSSFVYFPIAFHLPTGVRYGIAQNRYSYLANIATPKLYSESGELSHFGGGPILTKDDVAGPEIFQKQPAIIWVVDTSGFGGSKLSVPTNYKLANEKSFSELFGYQGDIIVRKYIFDVL